MLAAAIQDGLMFKQREGWKAGAKVEVRPGDERRMSGGETGKNGWKGE